MLLKHVLDRWVAASLTAGNLVYDDIVVNNLPGANQTWARLNLKNTESRQSSLADYTSKAIFSRTAILTIQLFTPRKTGKTESDRVGQILLDMFERKKADCIWFRDVRIREIGNDGSFFNINVIVDVLYDQVK